MTPLSDSEARTVARFENAQPAPESWGHAHHWIGTHDHGPVCSVCGIAKPECGDDEIATLHAKAAGADRVRELHRPWRDLPICQECTDEITVGWPCATIDALDGTDRTDRGRC